MEEYENEARIPESVLNEKARNIAEWCRQNNLILVANHGKVSFKRKH